jgi:beta-lactam-binding protein with PASTA domain
VPFKLASYKGRNIKDVQPLLEGKYLIVSVQNREDDSSPGTILDQQPSEGTMLKAGGSVTFITAIPLTTFPMPQVVGEPLQKAIRRLTEVGLKVSKAHGDCITVTSTSPPVVKDVPKETSVTIYTHGDPNKLCNKFTSKVGPGIRPERPELRRSPR